MTNLTAKYTVKRAGWQGKVTMADGSDGVTKLFCYGDKRVLEDALQAMQNTNQIKAFSIEWVEIECPAG